MRCSICDRSDTRYVYDHWHCSQCEDSIRQTIGDIREEDVIEIFGGDDKDYDLSVDNSDYSSLENEED